MAPGTAAAFGIAPLRNDAAQYVRMSTEHQRYSTAYQKAAIAEYAAARGIRVVKTYVDEAKSGLVLEGREGLKGLLRDVISGTPGYETILVYDITRWGRFQDVDESAHYEFLCRKAGVQVHYCAEPFSNDGTAITAVFKAIKRAMAADYSRDLSGRVFRGQCIAVQLGFRQGASPCYGLRRMLIGHDGTKKGELSVGQWKALSSDKIILVPGPRNEVDTVRNIFTWFVENRVSAIDIASRLTMAGVPAMRGGSWSPATIRHMLRNEIYVGTNVFGKTSQKLCGDRKKNPRSEWIRREGAFEAIVDRSLFDRAQAILKMPLRYLSDEEIIARLKALYTREGRISNGVVRGASDLPCVHTIRKRIGNAAYLHSLVGAVPTGAFRFGHVTDLMRRLEKEILTEIFAIQPDILNVHSSSDHLTVVMGQDLTLRIASAQPSLLPSGDWFWTIALPLARRGDWNLVVRCNVEENTALDYLLLPRWGNRIGRVSLHRDLTPEFSTHAYATMEAVIERLPQLRRLRSPPDNRYGPGKYLPLRQYLETMVEDRVEMGLDEIVQVLGADLPASARCPIWWENSRILKHRSVQAKAWMGAGYMATLQAEKQVATFKRMTADQCRDLL
jgi:DNA invertase Pin-like site-specific DNA recombinase